MNVTQPLAFALLLLAVPTVAAYLHRRKRKVKPVSSIIMFRVIAGSNTPTKRALAQPRHWVSLILVVLALLAMVLAVVDLGDEGTHPRDYVFVLDTSASMGARTPGSESTRLDDARDRLDDALASMGPGDRVALVTAAQTSSVVIGLTEDLARVRELAATQQAAGSSAGMPQALRIADAMASRDGSRVVVFSDGVGVAIPKLQRMPEWEAVGRAGPNVGINALAVREADALGLVEIFIGLTADVPARREVDLTLQVDEQIVDVVSVEIPRSGPIEVLHRVQLPEGARVTATLTPTDDDDDDILAADDVAITPRRAGDRVRTLLVAPSRSSFTAEALRLHPRVDLTVVGPYDEPPHPRYDLVILESLPSQGTVPATEHLVAFGTDPTAFGLPSGRRVASPRILRWSFDDPLFRFVDLTDIDLPRAIVAGSAPPGWTPIVDAESGPLALRTRQDGVDRVYFGFAPADSDLVLRVGFVNLMANLVEWAAPAGSADVIEARVLPVEETLLDPVVVPGTVTGTLARRAPTGRPWWQWLVWLAATLIAIEGLLAPGRAMTGRIAARWRARRAGGSA